MRGSAVASMLAVMALSREADDWLVWRVATSAAFPSAPRSLPGDTTGSLPGDTTGSLPGDTMCSLPGETIGEGGGLLEAPDGFRPDVTGTVAPVWERPEFSDDLRPLEVAGSLSDVGIAVKGASRATRIAGNTGIPNAATA